MKTITLMNTPARETMRLWARAYASARGHLSALRRSSLCKAGEIERAIGLVQQARERWFNARLVCWAETLVAAPVAAGATTADASHLANQANASTDKEVHNGSAKLGKPLQLEQSEYDSLLGHLRHDRQLLGNSAWLAISPSRHGAVLRDVSSILSRLQRARVWNLQSLRYELCLSGGKEAVPGSGEPGAVTPEDYPRGEERSKA